MLLIAVHVVISALGQFDLADNFSSATPVETNSVRTGRGSAVRSVIRRMTNYLISRVFYALNAL